MFIYLGIQYTKAYNVAKAKNKELMDLSRSKWGTWEELEGGQRRRKEKELYFNLK